MATELQQYRGTAAEWASANPVLADGELGFEKDTKVIKIGDGVTAWNALGVPYVPSSLLTANGDLISASASGVPSRVPGAAPGSTKILTVQPDGSLAWDDDIDLSALELIGHAASTYQTISSEATIDAGKESISHAAATYVTQVNAATQHANYETLDHMVATYLQKSYAAATYEPKWTYKMKPANTTRISTTTLAVDPDLVFPVVAGGVYNFDMGLFLDDISTTADFQFGMTPGISTNWHAGLHGAPTSATITDTTFNHRVMGTGPNELLTLNIAGLGAFLYVSIKGIVSVTTAGNFGLTWAQFTSAASPGTILYKGSYLKALRIS